MFGCLVWGGSHRVRRPRAVVAAQGGTDTRVEIISHWRWLSHRFPLSLREVERDAAPDLYAVRASGSAQVHAIEGRCEVFYRSRSCSVLCWFASADGEVVNMSTLRVWTKPAMAGSWLRTLTTARHRPDCVVVITSLERAASCRN